MSESTIRQLNPSFHIATPLNLSLVKRVYAKTVRFQPSLPNNSHPDYKLSELDLFSPLIRLKPLSGGDLVWSFFNKWWFDALFFATDKPGNLPNTGDQLTARVPDSQSTDPNGRSVRGEVIEVREAVGIQQIRDLIDSGLVPQILSSMHITVDLTSSFLTAMEFGADYFQLLDSAVMQSLVSEKLFSPSQLSPGEEFEASELFAGLPITRRLPVSTEVMRNVLIAALQEINTIYRRVRSVGGELVAMQLLPVSHMVHATVTKSIVEWRNFFLTDSQVLETLSMKALLFNEFNSRVPALFHGCDQCQIALKAFTQVCP